MDPNLPQCEGPRVPLVLCNVSPSGRVGTLGADASAVREFYPTLSVAAKSLPLRHLLLADYGAVDSPSSS